MSDYPYTHPYLYPVLGLKLRVLLQSRYDDLSSSAAVGFSRLQERMTMSRLIKLLKLPPQPQVHPPPNDARTPAYFLVVCLLPPPCASVLKDSLRAEFWRT